jgi:hypothetical protein
MATSPERDEGSQFRPRAPRRVEVLLYHYAWGRPKETVELAREPRRPFKIVLRGPHRDPLEVEAEPVDHPERKLPALPTQMREIGFEPNLEDLDPTPGR